MKNTLAAIILIALGFAFNSNLSAQSRHLQRTQAAMGGSGRSDLNSTLIDLGRISQTMQEDIDNLQLDRWKSGWKTGFLKGGAHKDQAQKSARSLQRNLSGALPGLIHDVQNSRGSISTTFKLYDDVSLVLETLDSLITSCEAAGKKGDAAPLDNDYSALTQVRRSLANYIQQAAANFEGRGKAPYVSFSAPKPQHAPQATAAPASGVRIVTDQGVKKIIVDDTIPEKETTPASTPNKKPLALSHL
jgi:hypothetical protein